MKFVVVELENDKKLILSEPQIISLVGQTVEITQESNDKSKKAMSLSVTPTLKE